MAPTAQRTATVFAPPALDPEHRDRAWMERARTGDYEAFECLFCAYAAPLCGYVDSVIRAPDEAQDLVQELFLWIWAHRVEWTVPGPISTYLYRSARNRAISHLRHRRIEEQFRLGWRSTDVRHLRRQPFSDTSHRADARELQRAIAEAVDELPERCRQVFILSRYHSLAYAEIAAVMKISVKTVEVHMGRALEGLRQRLAEWL